MVGQFARRSFWSLPVPRRRALIPLHLARRPAPQMFENLADDFCVIDQRDDLHRRAALGTFQRIDLVDLVDQSRPRGRSPRTLVEYQPTYRTKCSNRSGTTMPPTAR